MADIGLNLKLDGAASFNQQMTQARNATKLLDAELKNIQNDANATNFEKASKSSEVLRQKLDVLKQQQAALNSEIEKATQKYGENDSHVLKLKTQLETLNGTIAKTEAEIEKNSGFNQLGESLQNLGGKLTAFGDGMSQVGQKLMPVTAAILGIGTASLAAAKNLDEGYDTIIKKTGATGAAADELKGQMDRIFTSIPTDAATAGTAIGEVNTRFGLTGDALGDLSQKFIEFADINETDVNNAIDSVDAIMTKFGVDSSETVNVLGLMTKAGQDTGISMDSLQNALQTNGATLKEMGLDLTASVNLLAQFEQSGVDSSIALAALKKAQQNATAEGKTLDQALNEQITSIKSASSETEALQIATELFGKKGAAEMTQAIREGRFSVDELSGSLTDYASTVTETYNETLDPWDQLTIATNNLKTAGADLATTLLTALQPTIDTIVQKVQELTEWFKGLDDSQKQTIITVAGIVAAVGPVLMIGGRLISGIGNLTTGIGTLMTKLTPLLAGAGSVAPIVLGVVAAIGLLVAGFVTLYKSNDDFREKVNGVWTQVKEFIQQTADQLKAIFEKFAELVNAIWDKWGEQIMTVVDTVFTVVSTVIGTALDVIFTIIDTVLALINGDWDTVFNNLQHIVEVILDAIGTIINTVLTATAEIIKSILSAIKEKWDEIWNNIKEKVSSIWENIKTAIRNGIEAAKTAISNKLSEIASFWSSKWQEVCNFATDIWETIKTKISESFKNIKSSVTDGFKEVIDSAKNWAKDMMDNFVNGIKEKIKAVKDAISSVTSTIAANLHFSEPDEGNLKDFNSWAPDMMSQYAQAIENGRYLVQHAISDVTADIAVLENPIDAAEIYNAVNAGASNANLSISIGDREFGRALKDLGVAFQ